MHALVGKLYMKTANFTATVYMWVEKQCTSQHEIPQLHIYSKIVNLFNLTPTAFIMYSLEQS